MEIDTLTLGTTDYEDILLGESAENMSAEDRTLAAGDAAGVLAPYNYTGLESVESIVSEVWESACVRVRAPGVQLHEALVLLLSALVVGVHGLLGVLTPRTAWALLHGGLGLGFMYGLACMVVALHGALCRRLFRDDDDVDEEEVEEEAEEEAEEEGDAVAADANAEAEEAPVPNIVSAQLEKEKRVQRWIDNLCSDREQVNLEACGEIKGRNMEAEVSSADLLGDGQPLGQPAPAPAGPTPTGTAPRCPRPLPLPPLPPTLSTADVAALSMEARRALALAYQLSVAVSQQTSSNGIRATMSAPDGGRFPGLGNAGMPRDGWKVIRHGKEALEESSRKGLSTQSTAQPTLQPAAIAPSPAAPKQPSESRARRPSVNEAEMVSEAEAPIRAAEANGAPLNSSSSLLNFVRRFSGTRFLLKELAAVTAEGLRLRDSRALSLQPHQQQLEPRRTAEEDPAAPAPPAPQRSVLGLPRVELDVSVEQGAVPPESTPAPATAPSPAPAPAHTPPAAHRDKSNVMKVFSKGILSEGSIDFSSTSIQDATRTQSALNALAGALCHLNHLNAEAQQQVPGSALSSARTRTTTTSTSTADSSDHPAFARSTVNLRAREPAEAQQDSGLALGLALGLAGTSRGLTASVSEEGPPRAALEDDHKSLFDLKKSYLTSIPEATPPDEDVSHNL